MAQQGGARTCSRKHLDFLSCQAQHRPKLKALLIFSPAKADARQRSLELRQGNLDRYVARSFRTVVNGTEAGAPIVVSLGKQRIHPLH
ncbi:hypothetical protein DUNSADRAFT_2951 [Dunaliella salina]|uniref:Encoded protein n=1 Tax=Dunaliella salina TaxID=3046 RepID=A0ABQ7FVS0_DUNSA|nr:hypothetical protein DUNSADRAFT_2951 [Dunaliella salina]|eukprot:KAF5826488.1 hypothetical protein DUNSADRAFT_2951 [Dunaliella salina]